MADRRRKIRNWLAVAAKLRGGAGKHTNKALKGSGKGQGRRHAKHKGEQDHDRR